MEKHSFKKQLPINLASNFVYFVITVLMGVWLPQYLIKHLGIAVYGLIPLALAVNDYIGISISSFNSAVARFLTIELQKNDEIEANKIFNTALWSSVFFVMLILPLLIIAAHFVPNFFNMPIGQEGNSRIFFMVMAGVFCVYAISGNFSVSSFAFNRFDLRNVVNCSDVITRIFIIVLLFSFFEGKLWFVGFAYLGGALVALVGVVYVWWILTPWLKISFKNFDKTRLSHITHMSGWVLLDQIGTVLFMSTEVILVNKLYGSEAAGRYAVILPWVMLLRAIVNIVSTTLTPIYFSYYAKGEVDRIIILLGKSIKFLGLIIALPIGLICGFATSILSVWLGQSFSSLAPLMWLLVGHLIITLTITPIFSIQVAFNKVRTPALVTFFMGLGQVAIAVFFARGVGLGIYGIALSVVLMYLLRNIGFSTLYVARILKTKLYSCIVTVIPGTISMIIIFGISAFLNYSLKPENWSSLLFCSVAIGLVYLALLRRFVLKPDEKQLLLSFVPTKWQGFI